jgi:tetratricopeptide (TPR) repeat protein
MKKRDYFLFGVLAVFTMGILWACQPKEVTSAKVYIQQNDWDKAIEQLEASIATNPQNAEAQYLLGQGYGKKSRYADMNRAFDASLAVENTYEAQITFEREKYWVEYFNKGVNFFNEEKIEEALKAFETAAVVQPKRTENYRNLATGYLRTDQFAKAEENFKKAIELEPDHVETLVNLGIAYYNNGDFAKSVETFEKALEHDPANADAISTLGLAYDQMGESNKAIQAYENALKINPDDMNLQFNYARLFYNKEQYEKALEHFKIILDKNPDDYDALLSTGDAYLRIADRLRLQAKELEEKNDKDPEATKLREKMKEYYKMSIPYLEKASAGKPDNRNLWFNLGIAHTQAGNAEKGKAAFAKAEELDKGKN